MKPLSLLAFLCSRLPLYEPAFARKQKSAVTGRVRRRLCLPVSLLDYGWWWWWWGGGEEAGGGGGGWVSALHAFESKLYMGGKRGLFALKTKLILSLFKTFNFNSPDVVD